MYIMKPRYLGHVSTGDPIFAYFRNEIQPRLAPIDNPGYRVFRMNGSNDVYLYEERNTNTRFVGKFFLSSRQPDRELSSRRLEREFNHLGMMRGNGFDSSPHYVARPLGKNHSLNSLLVVEYCHGELLSDIINTAIRDNHYHPLYQRLTALAYFLSRFHNRNAGNCQVNFNNASSYLDSLINRLRDMRLMPWAEAEWFHQLKERWHGNSRMWEDREVVVHGDATPENFLHGDGLHVISYDLERLRRADRVHDVGRLAAELAHFLMLNTGDRYRAEPDRKSVV